MSRPTPLPRHRARLCVATTRPLHVRDLYAACHPWYTARGSSHVRVRASMARPVSINTFGAVHMLTVILTCVLSGAVLSLPLIRATRRAEASRLVLVRRGDYLRTRRASRLSRVSANSFGVRL